MNHKKYLLKKIQGQVSLIPYFICIALCALIMALYGYDFVEKQEVAESVVIFPSLQKLTDSTFTISKDVHLMIDYESGSHDHLTKNIDYFILESLDTNSKIISDSIIKLVNTNDSKIVIKGYTEYIDTIRIKYNANHPISYGIISTNRKLPNGFKKQIETFNKGM